jgi:hypothetical protein
MGYDAALADEAMAVLMHVDAIAPGQQRFAQLMEQLTQLAPMRAWWQRRRPASTRRRTAPCRNDDSAQQLPVRLSAAGQMITLKCAAPRLRLIAVNIEGI